MTIYDKYCMMKPFIGKNYGKGNKPAILLIGESHYFPENSSNHVSANVWYSGIADRLNKEEKRWINTSKIIERSRENGFKIRSHSIWKKPFKIINKYGTNYQDFTRVTDDIAFFNFFMRPSTKGKSFKSVREEKDVEVANNTFMYNYHRINPSHIVFLSRFARNNFEHRKDICAEIVTTPHPGCSWWNRKSKVYGNKRGKDILIDFVKGLQW